MPDTILVLEGVVQVVARAPCDETSFGSEGVIAKVPDSTAFAGMLWDGVHLTNPPPPPVED